MENHALDYCLRKWCNRRKRMTYQSVGHLEMWTITIRRRIRSILKDLESHKELIKQNWHYFQKRCIYHVLTVSIFDLSFRTTFLSVFMIIDIILSSTHERNRCQFFAIIISFIECNANYKCTFVFSDVYIVCLSQSMEM